VKKTPISIDIPLSTINALSLFFDTNSHKLYHTGLILADGYIAATDGACIAACKLNPLDSETLGDSRLFVPGKAIAVMLKAFKPGFKKFSLSKDSNQVMTFVTLEFNDITTPTKLDIKAFNYADTVASAELLNLRLPSLVKHLPTHDVAKDHSSFSWSYLALCQKAAKILGCSVGQAHLLPNGKDAAKITLPIDDDWIIALAPMV